jgi:hypothetical protein
MPIGSASAPSPARVMTIGEYVHFGRVTAVHRSERRNSTGPQRSLLSGNHSNHGVEWKTDQPNVSSTIFAAARRRTTRAGVKPEMAERAWTLQRVEISFGNGLIRRSTLAETARPLLRRELMRAQGWTELYDWRVDRKDTAPLFLRPAASATPILSLPRWETKCSIATSKT